MIKKDIEDRDDVFALVSAFYEKVRRNKEIGAFFNETIDDWPSHIEKLTDFWETNLFFVSKFRGNPLRAHNMVDDNFNNAIEQKHFGEWLNMWFETVDEMFEGDRAWTAKNRARNIASNLFMAIYENRQR